MRNTKASKLKWLSLLLAVVFSLSVFAACTPDDPSGGGENPPPADEQDSYYTVNFLDEDNTTSLRKQTVKSGKMRSTGRPKNRARTLLAGIPTAPARKCSASARR